MMKTILIAPPYTLEERYGRRMKSFGAVTEPMGLAYLAGSLDSAGFPVEILDAPALGLDAEAVTARVREGDFSVVGISLLTPMFAVVADLCKRIRGALPSVHITLGGAHPTALPEKTLEEIVWADSVCIGEGERTIVELVSVLDQGGDLGTVAGIAFRRGTDIVRNRPRPFERDLDAIAPPARHLLPLGGYRLTASRTRGDRFCPTLIVARGCPFNCAFCSHPFGRTFRHHSVERVLAEMKELRDRYGASQVNLEADTLTLNKGFLMDLCRAIAESGIGLRWTCESRVDTVDEEMLRAMRAAGCWQISYGVESGSQRLLDAIQKGVTKEEVKRVFALTRKAGITIRAFFMLGLPGETRAESLETIRFACSLDPLWAQFTVTVPYPGTPLFQSLEAQGRIRHYDWSHYNTWGGWAGTKLPYVPPERTEDELRGLQRKAARSFYLRPSVVLRFARSLKSPAELKKLARGFVVLLRSR